MANETSAKTILKNGSNVAFFPDDVGNLKDPPPVLLALT